LPLIDRSISNSASIRRTISIAIGDSEISFLAAPEIGGGNPTITVFALKP
jgi:hypothetical protein